LRPGTRVLAEGPYGALTAARRRKRKVLLIAGGIGITPLRALLESVPGAARDITMIYRAGADDAVVFRDELTALAAYRRARLHFVTGHRHSYRHDPLSSAALTANVPDVAAHDVYVCGPDGMTSAVVTALRKAGVPRRQIHHESFQF
jgi:ferredoxin-NADP reductase